VARLKAADFDERLTLVEHLDELRTRIIVAGAAFAVALGLCFWQNDLLLDLANRPLPGDRVPLTFGVTEPLMTTLVVAAYGALLLSAPIVLYQLYAFLLPALKPGERRVAIPMMVIGPILFIAGAVFAYFVVMPAAIRFLLQFNNDQFNIQIRAREYYGFFGMTVLSMGAIFEMPVVIVALSRMGIVSPDQLAGNRRYAVLAIAVIAMLLPGTDPISMLIEMVPLLALFELSLMLARAFGRSADDRIDTRPSPQRQ
jgi:sec-independent protein translocase protein TatC